MLATMSPSQHDLTRRDNPHSDIQQENRDIIPTESALMEDRMCPGCKKPAVNEQGGLVVAFGQSFFHVNCFKCAKCGDQVTADTSLLLLSDGSPICTNCTYSCNVCHQPILDEAIMTGDDSYHAHCFKCKVCKSRIDDLVFAKTSQGIYCMQCHNERMARIRNYVQKKAERGKEKGAGSSSSNKSREHEARKFHADNSTSPASGDLYSSSSTSRSPDTLVSSRSPTRHVGPYVSDAFASNSQTPNSNPARPPLASYSSSQSLSVTSSASSEQPKRPSHLTRSESDQLNPAKQTTLPLPAHPETTLEERRRSYDDGVRPLNVLFGHKTGPIQQPLDTPMTAPAIPESLAAPTSQRDKRRSINPSLLSDLSPSSVPSTSQSAATPQTTSSPTVTSIDQALTPPASAGRDSPIVTRSPFREQSDSQPLSSRPTSHSSSRLSHTSLRSVTSLPYSAEDDSSHASSPSRSLDHSQDQTVVIQPPISTVTVGSVPPSKGRSKHIVNPNAGGPQGGDARLSVSTKELEALRSMRSFDDRRTGSRPSSGTSYKSQRHSRSVSPAHRADVPHSIESETDDTDPEGESLDPHPQARDSLPPPPPPKEERDIDRVRDVLGNHDLASSELSLEGSPEDFSDLSVVERTPHSTFIAPALPPIRLSMTSADFSELFDSVGGFPSRKSLDKLAMISEDRVMDALTPPPTAATAFTDESITPTYQDTFLHLQDSENEDITIRQSESDDSGQSADQPLPPAKNSKVNGVFRRPSASSASDSSRAFYPPSSLANSGEETISEQERASHRPPSSSTRITITEPGSKVATKLQQSTPELVSTRLQEAITDARERGAQQLKMDRAFVEAILSTVEAQKADYKQLKNKFDGMKRTSRHYIEGLTVAQAEYDRELKARRDAEAEVTRLRVLLSGQVAKLTALSGENRRDQLRQQQSKELHDNLSGLEQDLSNLRVERDMTLAEVEELEASKSGSPDLPPSNLGRSLTKRLESLKSQYKRDLVPLQKEREGLHREITELKGVRDVFLEETTVLNARNEELAQLSAAYSRRIETVHEVSSNGYHDSRKPSLDHHRMQSLQQQQQQPVPIPPSISSSTSVSSTLHDDTMMDVRHLKVQRQEQEQHSTPSKPKFMKWGSKAKEAIMPHTAMDKKALSEHNFQQLSILRFTRCDHCGDKMWGSQLRCTACPVSIHVRCVTHVRIPCVQQQQFANLNAELPPTPLPPSMFGRDLVEQIQADSKGNNRQVPVIVEKCIQAVEAIALDYEGIYRKTGGAGQSKAITQLFERGDYASFDLQDSDRFNDICSVTSVLKNYFRALPVPLLTYDLHDDFMDAIHMKDATARYATMLDLVGKLPNEHYFTLRQLMLHLHRVQERSEINKMNARNLGVVFGPTLMRSRDPSSEFSDMAGKALSVEWFIENASSIFNS